MAAPPESHAFRERFGEAAPEGDRSPAAAERVDLSGERGLAVGVRHEGTAGADEEGLDDQDSRGSLAVA